jgi:hypothetical protein
MRRASLLLVLLAIAGVTAAFAHGGATPTSFRLADASAACRVQGDRLVCSNLTVRSGLSLPGRGTPRAVAAQVWWDASTPVLRRWQHAGVTCSAAAGSILCRNASGASISVAPAQLSVAL